MVVFTAPVLAGDERFVSRLISDSGPAIIICDVHPKGIGLSPHLIKVCEKGRASWSWFVNDASLGSAQSRERKIMVFATGSVSSECQFAPIYVLDVIIPEYLIAHW